MDAEISRHVSLADHVNLRSTHDCSRLDQHEAIQVFVDVGEYVDWSGRRDVGVIAGTMNIGFGRLIAQLDAGAHHALALDRSGKRPLDSAPPNDQGKLRALIAKRKATSL